MAEFEREAFAAKDWINAACKARPSDEPLEKFVAQLEVQLQLKCEEVETEIEATSAKLVQQIPFVLQEAEKIKSEMMQLHETLKTTSQGLKGRSEHAQEVVSGLKELHLIKTNMQSACDSLKEATELSELFVRVDAVFSSGDIFAMAKILSMMHKSLKLVGNVPEFQAGKQKLKTLKENLISSVESKLAAALHDKDDDHVTKLTEILESLDHIESLEKTYVAVKKQEMKSVLKSVADQLMEASKMTTERQNGVSGVVRQWHEALLGKMQEDLEWCCTLFPEHGARLLTAPLTALLSEWNTSLEDLFRNETSIEVAALVQEATLEFCLTMRELVEPVIGKSAMDGIVACAFVPVEKAVERFSLLERQILMQAMHVAVASFGSASEMEASIEVVFELIGRALEDCLRFTGGSEIENLASEIESFLTKYITNMMTALRQIRTQAIPDMPEHESDMTHVLDLLKIGRTLAKKLDGLTQVIVKTLSEIQERLSQAPSVLDLTQMRLRRLPEKEQRLQAFLESKQWTGRNSVRRSVDGFVAASEALVYDALMHKPRSLFAGFSEMPEWQNEESEAAGLPLPQFSAYPLHYISALGEYLMMVPQQLEALVSSEVEIDDERLSDQEAEEEMASALFTKVIVGSAELYADEILSLKRLSASGVVQLACDLQYFSNVLAAMGLSFPQPLITVYEAVQTPLDQLQGRMDALSAESNAYVIFQTLLKMRDIDRA